MNIEKLMTKVVSLVAVAILYVASTASAIANQNDVVILYLNDPMGSAVAAYDENGDVCWEEVHTPYGDKTVMEDSFNRASCGVVIEERGFTGHTDDYETDLVYMQQRYYDPTVGRFLSTDPVGPKVGSPISINRYSYAANNPYKYVDPNGEEAVSATLIVGYGVVALGAAITATETYSTYKSEGVGAAAKTLVVGAIASAAGGKLAASAVKYRSRLTSLFKSKNDVPKSVANNFSREITPDDLGVKGNLKELAGSFAVKDGIATARIDMIRGEIRNPLEIVNNLSNTARASGANSLRIEGTLANDRLYNVLSKRYGLTSEGATDVITIPLK